MTLPGESPERAESVGGRFQVAAFGGVELCVVVSYFKDGRHDLRALARGLTGEAKIQYDRRKRKTPAGWYEMDPAGYRKHLWKLRRKARDKGWYDAIAKDYWRKYVSG